MFLQLEKLKNSLVGNDISSSVEALKWDGITFEKYREENLWTSGMNKNHINIQSHIVLLFVLFCTSCIYWYVMKLYKTKSCTVYNLMSCSIYIFLLLLRGKTSKVVCMFCLFIKNSLLFFKLYFCLAYLNPHPAYGAVGHIELFLIPASAPQLV